MADIKKIFAVIDPTTQTQRALNRAVYGAKSTGASIHVYCCIFSAMDADDAEELAKVETMRYQAWLADMVAPIRADGIELAVEIEWHANWRGALGEAAKRADSDLIIKNSHRRGDRRRSLLSSSDWSLFHSANCPVLLAKSERSSATGKILLAVNLANRDETGDKLIDSMVDYARAAEASYKNGELHVLGAYEGSADYIHATDLVKRTGIDNECAHVIGERPEIAIQKCADELDAELIILGVSRTSRIRGILFGSTTEWLLNHSDRDIMVAIPKEQSTD